MQGKLLLLRGMLQESSRRNMSVRASDSVFWILILHVCILFLFVCSKTIPVCVQPPLVWKFIRWTSSRTVGKSASTAGTPPDKRNSVVYVMVTSKWYFSHKPCFGFFLSINFGFSEDNLWFSLVHTKQFHTKYDDTSDWLAFSWVLSEH